MIALFVWTVGDLVGGVFFVLLMLTALVLWIADKLDERRRRRRNRQ